VTYAKKEGDYFWFTYDEDAFTLKLRKPVGGLSVVEMTPKKALADGFQVGQTLPDFHSTKRQNLFDGTWVGTINGHAGFVKFTLFISGAGTVESDTSRLGPRSAVRHATNDRKTMTWHWGIENKEIVTFSPNSDGKTAVMTSAGPATHGMSGYNASAIFHRTSP
jgi:hypothetical protein